jgi:hypothetical protein
VARFTEGIPWTTAGFETAQVESTDPRARVLGLRGRTLTLLWAQNRAHTWWNVVHGEAVPRIDNALLTVRGLEDGRYRVECWDTWTGEMTPLKEARAAGGAAAFALPPLRRDLAFKLILEERN